MYHLREISLRKHFKKQQKYKTSTALFKDLRSLNEFGAQDEDFQGVHARTMSM